MKGWIRVHDQHQHPTPGLPMIRIPGNKKLLTLFGSFTLKSSMIRGGLMTSTLLVVFYLAPYHRTGTCIPVLDTLALITEVGFDTIGYSTRWCSTPRSCGPCKHPVCARRSPCGSRSGSWTRSALPGCARRPIPPA